ncbi:MAG: protein-glutamate O-methyltransferase CheR [Gemmatimonadetes bacterium]|nr:protein-glutamate O-methyltransferase CheR [Gemmatimonadota bacterium]NNM07479.1 protein-glutamate O-methyltransferase CheR [Gemmatimonadota bacterium]
MTSAAMSLVLSGRYGLDPAQLGDWRIEYAAKTRRRALGLDSSSEYDRKLESDGNEQLRLVELLLVHESSFLRHKRSFEHLRESLGNGRRNPTRHRPLRVVSVGCAGGEEPYSVAISLLESGVDPEAIRINAVDISPAVLRRAAAGVYSDRSVREIPSEVRRRWFEIEGEGKWRLKEPIRRLVTFQLGNVLEPVDPRLGTHHVVLCRNLLIYLAPAARERLASLLGRTLAPQGTLYCGQSEVLPLSRLGFAIEDRRALALRHPQGRRP